MTRARTFVLGLAVLAAAPPAEAQVAKLPRVREALAGLEIASARALIEGDAPDSRDAARAIGLVALYEGDCARAAEVLSLYPAVEEGDLGGADEVARGCGRTTAGAVSVEDAALGLVVRVKSDLDLPFVPLVAEVAAQARDAIQKELGAELPRPLRIEIVPDQFSLALHTGLPEKAAQTTGTVAVAKWGKVTMLSPRAMQGGYGWADTLAHEITHLVVTRATRDRAPLWLQEGVAKREEIRWRKPWPGDLSPTPEAVARWGFGKGLALPLDRLGPSIAMLPSGEMAMVAYAEVHSFVRWLETDRGTGTIARLLAATGDERPPEGIDRALERTAGGRLAALSPKWQATLDAQPEPSASELPGQKPPPGARDADRWAKLGDLLYARGHFTAAVSQYKRAVQVLPHDAGLRGRLGLALHAAKQPEARDAAVKQEGAAASLFLVRGVGTREHGGAGDADFKSAKWLDPFAAEVACELAAAPGDARAKGICDAARDRSTRVR